MVAEGDEDEDGGVAVELVEEEEAAEEDVVGRLEAALL